MMTDEEFNRLLNGPLSHPLPMFTISRLAMALRFLVDASERGEDALRAYCAGLEARDDSTD